MYAPPELLLSGIYSRTTSTAWSLGILLFNMLGKVGGVYAPPELLLSYIYSRTASIAWSLGILLFNMLGKVGECTLL